MVATAADRMVECLLEWGVDTVFGLPGDGINGIIESLRQRQDRIRFVQVRHEETAALMACGYAKFTGKLGVCLATSGPGGIHLLNGLYDAALDGQFLGRVEHRVAVVDLWPWHDRQDNRADALLSNVWVTRRGNAGRSNHRRRRVVPWRIGWSPRTAKGEKPFRIRFSTRTRGWVTVPLPACGGWVGNGPPRKAGAFPAKRNASRDWPPRSTLCSIEVHRATSQVANL